MDLGLLLRYCCGCAPGSGHPYTREWPHSAQATDMMELSDQLKALADPARLRIIQLLPGRPVCADAVNVSDIVAALDMPQPTVSHHLKILKQAGMIQKHKVARDCYYYVDQDAIEQAVAQLRDVALQEQGTSED